MIVYFIQILCIAAQIPGIIQGNHASCFSGGFCLGVFLMTLTNGMKK